MDYFQKQRKYGAGGHLWTSACAGILLFTYVRYQERRGKVVVNVDPLPDGSRFDEKPETVSGAQLYVRSVKEFCAEHNRATSFGLLTVAMGIWTSRVYGALSRLMTNRYSDVHYQITRPDRIMNKVNAIKFLVIPGMVVPLFGAAFVASVYTRKSGIEVDGQIREMIASFKGQGYYFFDHQLAQLNESPLAHFARNGKVISAGFPK